MNFLKYFQLALEGTMAVENVLGPADVPGSSKLALVLAGIDAAAKTAAGSAIPQVAGVGALIVVGEEVLVPLINNFVKVFHDFGLFHHKAKPVVGLGPATATAVGMPGPRVVFARP